MGISLLCAQMLLVEHRYRRIRGNVVTIGRHSVDLTGDEMDRLLVSMGIQKRLGFVYETDADTMSRPSDRDTITQESFFGAFTDAEVLSLDVSDYEKANLIVDLQGRLPWRYRKYADFVFDGGSLDNIFDGAAAIRNISRMLKSGGRFLAMNTGGPNSAAYIKFSADWFMDFFAFNQYEDCKVYICNYPNTIDIPLSVQRLGKSHDKSPNHINVLSFNPYVEHETGVGYDCSSIETASRYQIYCIAEKARKSTDDLNPIQKHYRIDPEHNTICNNSAKRFLHSPRPLFSNTTPFDPKAIPRIDSSDYPEQLKPVAIINAKTAAEIGFNGFPSW